MKPGGYHDEIIKNFKTAFFTCVKRTYWGFTGIGYSLGTMGKTSKNLTAVFIPCKAHLWRLYGIWGSLGPLTGALQKLGTPWGSWGKHQK
jgi:hypothetical protein